MDGESQNSQDARIEDLFRALDAEGRNELDIDNLRAGLKRIDHPLKNASALVEKILKSIDTDNDSRISFEEFKTFVKRTEQELMFMFEAIDSNHDGALDRSELQKAFRNARLTVSNRKLDQFFNTMDTNNDGVVSFDEFRNFLLFLPDAQNLESVLSYYNSTTVSLGPDGDVSVSSDMATSGLAQPQRKPSSNRISSYSAGNDRDRLLYPSPLDPDMSLPQNSTELIVEKTEPLTYPKIDWSNWETMKPVLIEYVPSTGYFAAGALAGIASRTTTAPIDRLKVYFIAQTGSSNSIKALRSGSPVAALTAGYQTTRAAVQDLWGAGGLRSLFAGNGINIAKVMPESAIKFGAFEGMKRVCAGWEGHRNPKNISTYSRIFSGGVAGVISQAIVYPLDTLKFRMQCETVSGGLHGNRLIWATAYKMWTKEGIRAFYKGVIPGLIGMAPYAALDLGTFEYLKTYVTERNMALGMHEYDARPSSFLTAAMGGFTGAMGATIVYPVNLVRTRLQTQGTILHPRTYKGFWDATMITVKGEGIGGLFKGIAPNLVKVVPAVSITYVVYEKCKKEWHLK